MSDLEQHTQALLHDCQAQGLYRRHRIAETAQGVQMRIDGRDVLSFCGNDYLGFANHPKIAEATIDAIMDYGVGSSSAHLVNGHCKLHQRCEAALAEFTGRDRALLFSTGYQANLAIPTLLGRHDHIFQDRLNHASLIDAAQLSAAKLHRYRHNDQAQLINLLTAAPDNRLKLIMTDAVFSMDGDQAPLKELGLLAKQHQAILMADDAHGFGVLGEKGAGSAEHFGLGQQQLPILMATLGKAIGVSGAFVAGSEGFIDALIQQARSYIFTTASPPALAAAVIKALELLKTESWRRERLQQNIELFKQAAAKQGLQLMPSDTAIQPIIIGDNQRAVEISDALFEAGFLVTAIRPPTVPEGTARLRVTLSAEHQSKHIQQLSELLAQLLD